MIRSAFAHSENDPKCVCALWKWSEVRLRTLKWSSHPSHNPRTTLAHPPKWGPHSRTTFVRRLQGYITIYPQTPEKGCAHSERGCATGCARLCAQPLHNLFFSRILGGAGFGKFFYPEAGVVHCKWPVPASPVILGGAQVRLRDDGPARDPEPHGVQRQRGVRDLRVLGARPVERERPDADEDLRPLLAGLRARE